MNEIARNPIESAKRRLTAAIDAELDELPFEEAEAVTRWLAADAAGRLEELGAEFFTEIGGQS